jgi:hypothetical protein
MGGEGRDLLGRLSHRAWILPPTQDGFCRSRATRTFCPSSRPGHTMVEPRLLLYGLSETKALSRRDQYGRRRAEGYLSRTVAEGLGEN